MQVKPNPEMERLKAEANKAHERLLRAVGRLESKFLLDEKVSQKPEPQRPNGKH